MELYFLHVLKPPRFILAFNTIRRDEKCNHFAVTVSLSLLDQ
jgi:hypothetical protein